jgi:hypothetical protein
MGGLRPTHRYAMNRAPGCLAERVADQGGYRVGGGVGLDFGHAGVWD